MIETLFGFNSASTDKGKGQPKKETAQTPQLIQIVNAKKAQNLSILLKALNVTADEVCDALLEGHSLFSTITYNDDINVIRVIKDNDSFTSIISLNHSLVDQEMSFPQNSFKPC